MILKLHDYKYFPYELELARREIESITDSDFSFNSEDGAEYETISHTKN